MGDGKPNHELSTMACPHTLEDVDLFSPGAQEHWYEAYPILHREAPVHIIPGEGFGPGSDGYILSKYEDIERVVKDPERFTPTMTIAMYPTVVSKIDTTRSLRLYKPLTTSAE